METRELLRLGFVDEIQYKQALEAYAKPDVVAHGAFSSKLSKYSFPLKDVLKSADYSLPVFSRLGDYPSEFNLLEGMPKIYNQGERGTCVSQAVTALVEYYFENNYSFSQQFFYWALKREDGGEASLREWLCSSDLYKYDDFLTFLRDNYKALSEIMFRQSNNPVFKENPKMAAEILIAGGVDANPEIFSYMQKEYRSTFGGATIVKAKTVLEKYGICEYNLMPYAPNEIFYTEAQSPELNSEELLAEIMQEALSNASGHRISDRLQIVVGNSVDAYKAAISGAGGKRPMPVVFGATIYSSLFTSFTKQTGWFSLPISGENSSGGHAMLAVGYKDTPLAPGGGYIIVRNSWGESWAWDFPHKGYARIPYAYIERDAQAAALTISAPKIDNSSFDEDDIWQSPKTDPFEKYIKIAPRDMRNRKGRYAISKGQAIIVDPETSKADIDTEANRKIFIDNGYSWED